MHISKSALAILIFLTSLFYWDNSGLKELPFTKMGQYFFLAANLVLFYIYCKNQENLKA